MYSLSETVNKLKRPLILAHRGSFNNMQIPENSLLAFQEAINLGADGFELDIQLSRDNELVVFHDRNLERLTGVKSEISALNFKEINCLLFLNNPGTTLCKIPSLNQVFSLFGSKCFYNIEIKRRISSYKVLKLKLRNLIKDFGLEQNVWISSFDPIFLWEWQKFEPNIPVAYLFESWNIYTKYICRRNFIQWLHPSLKLLQYLPELENISEHFCFWVVNKEEDLQSMLKHKVTGIITDNVSITKKVISDAV